MIVNSLEFKKQMDKQFHINVKCIFNPLNSKYIIQQSKRGKFDRFFKTKNKNFKINKFR